MTSFNADQNRLTKNIEKLNRFLTFSENWNGYGAKPFSSQVIEKAIRLIKSLKYQPEVFPIPGGCIQFEYEKDNGSYIEFEIPDNNDMIFGYKENVKNRDTGGETFVIFTDDLNKTIVEFMEKDY